MELLNYKEEITWQKTNRIIYRVENFTLDPPIKLMGN